MTGEKFDLIASLPSHHAGDHLDAMQRIRMAQRNCCELQSTRCSAQRFTCICCCCRAKSLVHDCSIGAAAVAASAADDDEEAVAPLPSATNNCMTTVSAEGTTNARTHARTHLQNVNERRDAQKPPGGALRVEHAMHLVDDNGAQHRLERCALVVVDLCTTKKINEKQSAACMCRSPTNAPQTAAADAASRAF